MDHETVITMQELSKNKVDLEDLKNKVLREEPDEGKLKTKLFSVSYDNASPKEILETQLNDFLNTLDPWQIHTIQFSTNKFPLSGTISGEFQETWNAMVVYEE